ncbi:MAG: DoxX family protein [Rhizobiales bacterium]|nr:DoxX family protein [Hyphomicrobiales bacterium]
MNSAILRFTGYLEMLPYSLLALIGRLAIGLVFWNSGRTKVDGWSLFHVNDKTLFLFQEEYRVPLLKPEFAALMAQIAEHVFPVLLFIGLATRFSALALFGMTMVIAIFVYPGAYVTHGLWAAVLLMLVKFGPGEISLDHLIARR